jgi:hypothetical protein
MVFVLQFRPVTVKQGMETSGSSVGLTTSDSSRPFDEVRINQFSLDEKQRRLRQEFLNRSAQKSQVSSGFRSWFGNCEEE